MKNPLFQLMPFLTRTSLFTKKRRLKTPYMGFIGSFIARISFKDFIPFSPTDFEQSMIVHETPKGPFAPSHMTTGVTDKKQRNFITAQ